MQQSIAQIELRMGNDEAPKGEEVSTDQDQGSGKELALAPPDAGERLMTLPLIVRPGEEPAHVGKWLTMTNEEYHADKLALSHSGIKAGKRSPAHFLATWTAEPEPPTPIMEIGSLTHLAVFERDQYKRVIARPDFGDGRTKAAKEAKTAWENERKPGDIVVSAEAKRCIDGMAESVLAHPLVAKLIEHGVAEQSGYWVDPDTGMLCRCRPDWLRPDGVMMDLKSTDDASPDAFARAIVKWSYAIQSAHYRAGSKAINGVEPGPWIFVAVEREPPYACAVYVADEAMLAHGRAERSRIMRAIEQSIRTNRWPAYSEQAQTISLPTWSLTSTEEFFQ